jgi:hypothetical protein
MMALGGLSLLAIASALPMFVACGARNDLCPKPHPESCDAITVCHCTDGTEQLAGCVNGFGCSEACCDHGDVEAAPLEVQHR